MLKITTYKQRLLNYLAGAKIFRCANVTVYVNTKYHFYDLVLYDGVRYYALKKQAVFDYVGNGFTLYSGYKLPLLHIRHYANHQYVFLQLPNPENVSTLKVRLNGNFTDCTSFVKCVNCTDINFKDRNGFTHKLTYAGCLDGVFYYTCKTNKSFGLRISRDDFGLSEGLFNDFMQSVYGR